MEPTIIDNWLDLTFCECLSENILYGISHDYGHLSNVKGKGEGNKFYYSALDINSCHVRYMCQRIVMDAEKEKCRAFHLTKEVDVIRVYANIQFKGMDGGFHVDDGDITVLYMVTPTLEDSGFFEYKENGKINRINFVRNRLILFSGNEHRGLSPNTDSPRVTVAFKMNKINESN